MTTRTAYIALGGNIGDRRHTLEKAVEMLDAVAGVEVTQVSELIETDPVGPAGQGKYLNGVVKVQTDLGPGELLAELHEIERALGRDRAKEGRWGARPCDLDILLIGDLVAKTPELTVPHPHMHDREFVLLPLVEIAPDAVHPVLGKTIAQLLEALEGQHQRK